jgi:hypothetical protein
MLAIVFTLFGMAVAGVVWIVKGSVRREDVDL